MIASILITLFSIVLFVYWFRYTCLLILQTKSTEDYAVRVATSNRLSFLEVQEQLRASQPVSLDALQQSLEKDYRILTYLFQHASGLGAQSVEQRILMLDYCIMRLLYRVTRSLAAPQARKSLQEMSNILNYFANTMGQRTASHLQA